MKMFHLKAIAIDEILEKVNVEVAQAADYFGLKIGGTASIPELLQGANIELSLLNMSYEQMNRELVQAKLQLENLTGELEEKNSYLESIANLDGLTEIYNHRYFQEFLDKEISRFNKGESRDEESGAHRGCKDSGCGAKPVAKNAPQHRIIHYHP